MAFFTSAPESVVAIDPSRLRPGLYVRLPTGWMAHPFLFNQFRIQTDAQVEILRGLGLETIDYLPARSEVAPLPESTAAPAVLAVAAVVKPAEVCAEKQQRAAHFAAQRARLQASEQRYQKAAVQVRSVMRNLFSSADHAVAASRELVGGVVESLCRDEGAIIYLMGEKLADDNAYFHCVNVMLLSVLLGRSLGLSREELQVLGEGALFHDIGETRVPDTVLRNPQRNRYEEEFFRLHPVYGVEIAREIGVLAPAAVEIIGSHHETMDGKGYPRGLAGAKIPRLARIVGLINRYDNLCNPVQRMAAITPAEALTVLFKSEGERWDPVLRQRLVRVLGVYPPGSLVQLSNGNLGVVVATSPTDVLRPTVMILDPTVPRSEALIVDLAQEPDLLVDTAVRPSEVDPVALEYLAPRRRLSYFHAARAD